MKIKHYCKKAEKQLLFILLFVSVSSVFTLFASQGVYGDSLKVLAVLIYFTGIIYSYNIIKSNLHVIKNFSRIVLGFSFIVLYPLLYTFFDLVESYSFKRLTDGLFIYGGFYLLLIYGLAVVVLIDDTRFYKVIHKYLLFTLPLSSYLFYLTLNSEIDFSINYGHRYITNFAIPGILFVFTSQNKYYKLLGFFSFFLLLFVSSKIWSRSYTLVGAFFFISYLIFLFKVGKKKEILKISICAGIIYSFGFLSFLSQESLIRTNSSVLDKFNFESLEAVFSEFINTGDFFALFLWEGNSRAVILIDAFKDFSLSNWFFGLGFFSKYNSFTNRSTIEMGWAQDVFRWGLIYVLCFLILIYRVRDILKKMLRDSNYLNSYNIIYFLVTVLVVRVVDGFIFGMPNISIYNLLFFTAILYGCKRKFKISRNEIDN